MPDQDLRQRLTDALHDADDDNVRYHIRSALQHVERTRSVEPPA